VNNNASFGYRQIQDGDSNLQRLVQRGDHPAGSRGRPEPEDRLSHGRLATLQLWPEGFLGAAEAYSRKRRCGIGN
jgi:hypothetical protein